MSCKRSRCNGEQYGEPGDRREELCGSLYDAVRVTLEEGFNELKVEQQKAREESARMLAEAHEAAAEVKNDAQRVEETRRDVERDRTTLEKEKAAMEKAHTFQTSKILLDVGGHKFSTSRTTLTSVPDTYLASLFSGRFELTTDAEGSYFIDRDGRHFHHILNCLRDFGRFELSSDVTEGQRKELAVEAEFYGLLDRMMPYHAQELIGRALLWRACLGGTRIELRTAVAQTRGLVFEMGSTAPFLTDEFQDLRWVITDRVVNGSPVWAAEGGKLFMYSDVANKTTISDEANCAEGSDRGHMCNLQATATAAAPTALPSDKWVSNARATLPSMYTSADRWTPGSPWTCVPSMRIALVHGLNDDDATMTATLRQLAALA
jgi:hypothetical protein